MENATTTDIHYHAALVSYNEPRETLKIKLPQTITPGHLNQLRIILSYTRKFRGDFTGLYQASYETDDGVKHSVAPTGLEPTYAKEVESLSL